MIPPTLQAMRNIAVITLASIPIVRWIRAWLYVRFFVKYEMAGCALESKVREGRA